MLLAIHLQGNKHSYGSKSQSPKFCMWLFLSSVFATSAPWIGQEGAELAERAKSPFGHVCDDDNQL